MGSLKDILYVEDDPDIQSIVKMALETIGQFNVRICDSGPEAISLLARWQPQLILLDVMMPCIDGLTTYRAIRSFPDAANIPVIFITAKVQKSEVQTYLDMGAIGVIAKPFDAVSLSTSIRDLWDEHLQKRVA